MSRFWVGRIDQGLAHGTTFGLLLFALAACSGTPDVSMPGKVSPGPQTPADERPVDGTSLSLQFQDTSGVSDAVAEARALDSAGLSAKYAVPFAESLGYDPTTATGLDTIQGSPLALNDAELAVLAERGFVIVPRQQHASFPYAYSAIYVNDLPVFVSADMVLEAVHRSYDAIVAALEATVLVPRVDGLLASMRGRLAAGDHGLDAAVAADVDFYLAVAASLITGTPQAPVAGAAASEVQSFVALANEAAGEKERDLFGVPRRFDFSQFKPRGHYTRSEDLQRYFRAMMWMGRIDFRLIETTEDGTQVFWRRQLEAALGLRALMNDVALEDWRSVDTTITAFVGEHDYMHVLELDALLADLGVSSLAELAALEDQRIAQTIIDRNYGQQRIASQIVRKSAAAGGTLPLDASFAFFGQRYTIDSHVFSNLVYDRVGNGRVPRVLPDPLDAAFVAFKNDQAVSLLSDELAEFAYAGDLAAMRALSDAHTEEYWQSSLYTGWLSALQKLSPGALEGGPAAAPGLPSVARSEAWGRRLVSTQLASWAELRHDTILYVKQSYTGGIGCDFPDAYVEPYPEFFRSIVALAEQGLQLVESLDSLGESGLAQPVSAYFGNLARVATVLAEMAELQRTGAPHTPEHLTFIKQAIRVEGGGSGPPWQTGWYKDLFYDQTGALDVDPTIADVHTDIGGELPVSRDPSVLHVGTGMPRTLVMTVDTCQGPRAYAGAVFAYHEQLEPGFTRLTDEEWAARISATPPEDAPWLAPALAPR
jgi:Protein of unknown function (DUF3160)